mgnify:CR=1 FL=1
MTFNNPALKDWAMERIIHDDAVGPLIILFLSESQPAAGRRDSADYSYFTNITFCVLIKSSAVILTRYTPLENSEASQLTI